MDWIDVPRDARQAECKRCRQECYWVDVAGRWTLVNTDVDGGVPPDAFQDGRGVNHHQECTG
jgi:hypothetical protein